MKHWRPFGFGNPYMRPEAKRPKEEDHGLIFEAGANEMLKALKGQRQKLTMGFVGGEQVEVKVPGMVIILIPEAPPCILNPRQELCGPCTHWRFNDHSYLSRMGLLDDSWWCSILTPHCLFDCPSCKPAPLFVCEKAGECKSRECICHRPHVHRPNTCDDWPCLTANKQVRCIPVKEKGVCGGPASRPNLDHPEWRKAEMRPNGEGHIRGGVWITPVEIRWSQE